MSRRDSLARYRIKRDFTKTPEPEGIAAKAKGNSYLIQKHAASYLHYDFRLELDGVLKSWAVPKGPALDPQVKRLAMEVEDHPVAYGGFEGIIPKGEYGGGTVMLWDRGTWEPVGNAQDGLKKGKLTFRLNGKRLKGEWTLVRFHGHEKARNQWFLIKHKDDEIRERDNGEFVQENTTSVVSGRSMEEIAEDKDRVWGHEDKKSKAISKSRHSRTSGNPGKASRLHANKNKLAAFIPPQLATLSSAVPKGGQWVHEIKFDGYRMLAFVENGNVRMMSRNEKDWTEAFGPIADLVAKLPMKNAILDGEVVAMDKDGKSNFSQLKDALSHGDYSAMQYYAFDLLALDGEDLRALSLLDRKKRLKALLDKAPAKVKKRILYSDHFSDEDGKFLQGVCSMHLEGVVSKRADAPYLSGRAKSWLKTKCIRREEMVVGGFTPPSNGSKGIGALLLGYYDDGELIYAGRVGTGWNNDTSLALRKKLDKLQADSSSFVAMTALGRRGAKWVKPQLVAEIEFTEWTPDGHMRHPSFEGLRDDKPAKEVKRDFAMPAKVAEKQAEKEVKSVISQYKNQSRVSLSLRERLGEGQHGKALPLAPHPSPLPEGEGTISTGKRKSTTGGIAITHPARIIFPESNITKLQLAEYYMRVADHILPHIRERPLSMLRCPEGTKEACFYQRHVGLGKSPHLYEIDIPVKGAKRSYMMIKDAKGLLSLIQWGVIELHGWQCTAKHLDKPDRMIFDLDPAADVPWKNMIEAAGEVRGRMSELGLESFLKTTGGKGLHIVVPLTPSSGWETIKSFTRTIAESMAHDSPKRYISTMSKAKRKGLIFIDYLRNEITSTAVAAFSARARDGATVSTPLDWRELATAKPGEFTIKSVPQRLEKIKDPWKDFFRVKQKIAAKYLKALNIPPE